MLLKYFRLRRRRSSDRRANFFVVKAATNIKLPNVWNSHRAAAQLISISELRTDLLDWPQLRDAWRAHEIHDTLKHADTKNIQQNLATSKTEANNKQTNKKKRPFETIAKKYARISNVELENWPQSEMLYCAHHRQLNWQTAND